MGKRLTYEFVKESFEKEGYELLSKEYINAHTKLRYRCPNGHRHSIVWGSWQQGARCSYCARNGKPTIKFIRSEFAKEGYKLLTKEYRNNSQRLNYICPKNHKHNTSWSNWKSGYRCLYCSGQDKLTIEYIKEQFEKENYILLTTEYKNNKQKLGYICPNGHKHFISWSEWSRGNRCPYCSGKAKKTIEFIKAEFKREEYTLLTIEYKNAYQKLNYICPKGHRHSITWGHWQQGQKCPECIITASKGEVQVRNFIESLGVEVLANNRDQIFNPETGNGLELDVFMPAFNKAIEYNGEYWHRNKINNDLLKQKLCASKDIDLLTIWDREWSNNTGKCKEKIMKFMFDVNGSFK